MRSPRILRYVQLSHLHLLLVLIGLTSSSLAQSCTNPVSTCDSNTDYFPDKITLEEVKTAKLTYANTYVDIQVTSSFGEIHKHRLVRCGCGQVVSKPPDTQIINVPPARIYVDDSPTLAFLTRSLGESDRIVAVGDPGVIYSSSIRSRFNVSTNATQLRNRTDVDVAFINLFATTKHRVNVSNIPFFVNGESAEPTPLGRSEWIKIYGLMFQSTETANTRYADILRRYTRMKTLANQAIRRPSVLLNYPFGSSWGMPSQGQYISQFLRDANVDYLYMNDGNNATNFLSPKQVEEKFKWARYLIHSGPIEPSDSREMQSFFEPQNNDGANVTNQLFRSLASVRCANVWIRNKRFVLDDKGTSNDFFEWGSVRPDLILQDIVHAVHPNIDVNNETTFSFKVDNAPDAIKGGPCPYNDLLGTAPEGKQYVDFEMQVNGQDRFQVENKLVENIIPQIAKDERVDVKAIDAFFEKPQQQGSTTLKLRLMVDENIAKDMADDGIKITRDVANALGGQATTELLTTTLVTGLVVQTSPGLGAGPIAGIVISCIVLVFVVGLLLFIVGSKRGRTAGEQATRDRFWREHGVRLLDDIEQADNQS